MQISSNKNNYLKYVYNELEIFSWWNPVKSKKNLVNYAKIAEYLLTKRWWNAIIVKEGQSQSLDLQEWF